MNKLLKGAPRDISPKAWYYVNTGSVDLVTKLDAGFVSTTRLTRKVLQAMLKELRPLRPRA